MVENATIRGFSAPIIQETHVQIQASSLQALGIKPEATAIVFDLYATLPPDQFLAALLSQQPEVFQAGFSPEKIKLIPDLIARHQSIAQYRSHLYTDDEALLEAARLEKGGYSFTEANRQVEQTFLRQKYKDDFQAYAKAADEYQRTYTTLFEPTASDESTSTTSEISEISADLDTLSKEIGAEITEDLHPVGTYYEGRINYGQVYFDIQVFPESGTFKIIDPNADEDSRQAKLKDPDSIKAILLDSYCESLWRTMTKNAPEISAETNDLELKNLFTNIFRKEIAQNDRQAFESLDSRITIANVIKILNLPGQPGDPFPSVNERIQTLTALCCPESSHYQTTLQLLKKADLAPKSFPTFIDQIKAPKKKPRKKPKLLQKDPIVAV